MKLVALVNLDSKALMRLTCFAGRRSNNSCNGSCTLQCRRQSRRAQQLIRQYEGTNARREVWSDAASNYHSLRLDVLRTPGDNSARQSTVFRNYAYLVNLQAPMPV